MSENIELKLNKDQVIALCEMLYMMADMNTFSDFEALILLETQVFVSKKRNNKRCKILLLNSQLLVLFRALNVVDFNNSFHQNTAIQIVAQMDKQRVNKGYVNI